MRGRGRSRSEADRALALDRLFGALADPTRRSLLARLALGPARVTDLARPYRMSLPAVSKHLRILEDAGLVARKVDGRVHRLRLTGGPLEAVEVWLDPFRSYWASTLGALQQRLGGPPAPRPARRRVR
ncbi:MAG TPA: metalloregulator ArsR/SmtB family transcription factor [Thermoplasmata archaeon]|nr:metalloregulator ArsR/SmtB family transcription factor [Thermoplasmata archaeon]